MNEPSTRQHVTMDNIESVLVYLWWHAELHCARFLVMSLYSYCRKLATISLYHILTRINGSQQIFSPNRLSVLTDMYSTPLLRFYSIVRLCYFFISPSLLCYGFLSEKVRINFGCQICGTDCLVMDFCMVFCDIKP